MTLKMIAAVVVALMTLNLCVRAEVFMGITDLGPMKNIQCVKMRPYFVKLNEALAIRLPQNQDPKQNLELATELVSHFRSESRLLERKKTHESKKHQRLALELFASLENTLGKCDLESYEILAKNYLVNDDYDPSTSKHDVLNRTRRIMESYRQKHAQECRPIYKEKFAKAIKSVAEQDLQRVQMAFETLDMSDFGDSNRDKSLLTMPTVRFSWKFIPKPVRKLVKQVGGQMKQTPLWESLKPQFKDKSFKKTYPVPTNQMFDDYLFNPCANYRQHLSEILTTARFDATLEDEGQQEFIHADQSFYRAMINNRLCGNLLDERQVLYKIFVESWKGWLKEEMYASL